MYYNRTKAGSGCGVERLIRLTLELWTSRLDCLSQPSVRETLQLVGPSEIGNDVLLPHFSNISPFASLCYVSHKLGLTMSEMEAG